MRRFAATLKSPRNRTLLIGSTYDYEERIAKFLEQDTCGKTVLHHAASRSQEHVEAILASLETGCPEMLDLLRAKDENGRTVFHYATTNKDTETLVYLLKSAKCVHNRSNYEELCAMLSIQDCWCKTVLHYAAGQGLDFVQIILSLFAPGSCEILELLKVQDQNGATVFHSVFESIMYQELSVYASIEDQTLESVCFDAVTLVVTRKV